MKILQNTEKKIDNIYHISDIHIRLIQRKEEYLTVFQNLYDFLDSKKYENSIIVITRMSFNLMLKEHEKRHKGFYKWINVLIF